MQENQAKNDKKKEYKAHLVLKRNLKFFDTDSHRTFSSTVDITSIQVLMQLVVH